MRKNTSSTLGQIDEWLGLANMACEENKLDLAFELTQRAKEQAEKVGYLHGIIVAIAVQARTYKLKQQITGSREDLEAMTKCAIELEKQLKMHRDIAEGDKLVIFEILAEVAAVKKDWKTAARLWKQILGLSGSKAMFLGRVYEHLGEALDKSGHHEEGKDWVNKAVKKLSRFRPKGGSAEEFVWQVWYSGALMKLYYILVKENDKKANKVREKIEKLVKFPALVHRRRQFTQLLRDLETF